MAEIRTERYRELALEAMKDPVLQAALAGLQERLGKGAAAAYRALPEGPGLRRVAHALRQSAIDRLDILLEALSDRVSRNGGRVFFAETAADAVDYCLRVARQAGVRRVVKGKSMVTEEIGLNPALEAEGIEVVETDLGEYIVQLSGQPPSHIIAPAIHKTRAEIGRLFAEKLSIPYTEDPPSLTQAARKALREKFLTADMGVSGCNLACAETGHITTVSNEGNIRMASTLPRVHLVLMGMERIAARLTDFDILLRLLSRGAAAQNLGGYVSFIAGPRKSEEADGPEEFHLVILDNGRSRILADPRFREMLCCIRCAACLNVCPVYAKIGGHAYGYPYSGPVGAVVTPLLVGVNRAKDLCLGESLCGACRDACPVDIDIPRMLLELRASLADGDRTWSVRRENRFEKAAFALWSLIVSNRRLYTAVLRIAALAQKPFVRNGMLRRLPFPLNGWSRSRDLRAFAGKTFMDRWKRERP